MISEPLFAAAAVVEVPAAVEAVVTEDCSVAVLEAVIALDQLTAKGKCRLGVQPAVQRAPGDEETQRQAHPAGVEEAEIFPGGGNTVAPQPKGTVRESSGKRSSAWRWRSTTSGPACTAR